MWFWWKEWYIALAIGVILALAGALSPQAREIQRWHQPRQK
jgi:predicted negative regulator of RcsB-dependent stress response